MMDSTFIFIFIFILYQIYCYLITILKYHWFFKVFFWKGSFALFYAYKSGNLAKFSWTQWLPLITAIIHHSIQTELPSFSLWELIHHLQLNLMSLFFRLCASFLSAGIS